VLLTGSPGGRTIINTVFTIVLGVVEYGLTGREAVDLARMHHQWLPDRVSLGAERRHGRGDRGAAEDGPRRDAPGPTAGGRQLDLGRAGRHGVRRARQADAGFKASVPSR
jgi:hypothetical protein